MAGGADDSSISESQVALTALVISLLALGAATAQLLQAIFGTAQGYYRCQSPVIGPWAGFTRLVWRWRGFRFETMFTVPVISLDSFGFVTEPENSVCNGYSNEEVTKFLLRLPPAKYIKRFRTVRNIKRQNVSHYPLELAQILLSARTTIAEIDNISEEEAMNEELELSSWWGHIRSFASWLQVPLSKPEYNADGPDSVTWLPLLQAIYRYELYALDRRHYIGTRAEDQKKFSSYRIHLDSGERRRVAVELVERSWSLLPAEVVKPFAQTDLGSLLVLANRLGMQWKDFKPTEGVLYAEGKNQSLYSPGIVRGFGILVEYRKEKDQDAATLERLPSAEADFFSCGILIDPFFGDYPLIPSRDGESSLLLAALSDWLDQKTAEKLYRARDSCKDDCPAGFDLVFDAGICLFNICLQCPGSGGINVPWPYQSQSILHSVFLSLEGRASLLYRLKSLVDFEAAEQGWDTDGLETILRKLKFLEKEYPKDFYANIRSTRKIEADYSLRPTTYSSGYKHTPQGPEELEWCEKGGSDERGLSASIRGNRIVKTQILQDLSLAYDLTVIKNQNDPGDIDITEDSENPEDSNSIDGIGTTAHQLRPNPWIESLDPDPGIVGKDWAERISPFTVELVHQLVDVAHKRFTNRKVSKYNAKDVEIWWRMIYRAIIWAMMVEFDPEAYPTVPSKYFSSKMPVYIA